MLLQNQALVRKSEGQASLTKIPIPRLRDDYILVRTVAIALNPTDWQTLDEPGTNGSIIGCDYAGIVEEIGKGVTKPFKRGDRVAGIVHGDNSIEPEDGAFARYIVAKGDIQMHIPPHMSFEEAATLGCGLFTVGMALYQHLHLPLPLPLTPTVHPTHPPTYIFIYGGSTATGTLAIQFAILSGLTVITTASRIHHPLLTSLGVSPTHIFDYTSPACAADILALTANTLVLVLDTVAVPSSAAICAAAMSSLPGGIYVNLMDVAFPRDDVTSLFFLGYTVMGEMFDYGGERWEVREGDWVWGKEWARYAERVVGEGRVRGHPVRVLDGGLGGVVGGMLEMREGKVRGEKLVVRVEETRWLD